MDEIDNKNIERAAVFLIDNFKSIREYVYE